MEPLTAVELECLRKIGQGRQSGLGPCSYAVLQRLLSKGFVERAPSFHRYLFDWSRSDYRLTVAGKQMLQKNNAY